MWPFKKKTPKKNKKRFYQAASVGRLTADWNVQPTSADADIIPNLKILRARSRDLCQNNDYARRFMSMLKVNVIGHKGILLQNKAKNANGTYDTGANTKIETAWKTWGKKGSCTMCGGYSWTGLQQAVIEAVARDGEVLIQKVKSGPFGFALHLIEIDHLDDDLNIPNQRIKGGVQRDQWGRPVAYYLFEDHPGDRPGVITRGSHIKLLARDVVHVFIKERPNQTRGVPWMVTPAYRLKQLGGMEEAELVASRVSASKMGFFISPDGNGFGGDDEETDTGAVISEAEPGTFEQLPEGMDFKSWDPNHPNAAFADFTKSMLRGIASGLNVSYVGLANDLEGVSYSSIRQGEMADRDAWRLLQAWFVENVIDPIYSDWMVMALISSQLDLPVHKADKFNHPHWMPRGWNWVDPQKEIVANIEAVKNGFKSLGDVISEQGQDIEEVFDRLARERELAEQYGLNLPVLSGDAPPLEPDKTKQITITAVDSKSFDNALKHNPDRIIKGKQDE